MSIEVQEVSKHYGEQRALDQVSFHIGRGEIVGFLGPNGAGKSTMMKILSGYIPPTAGHARVDGLDLAEEALEVRRRVGYLPENNPLYLEMYVQEYLRFMAGIHGTGKAAIPSMIQKVGLSPEQHKKLGQLSKGYRQRVGLAAALLHDPEVLILDEPTTGLDPNQIVEIRELIRQEGQAKTVMLSTHIMQEVELVCDRVIIINKGQIVADRPVKELQALQGKQSFSVEFSDALSASQLRKIDAIEEVEAQNEAQTRWRVYTAPGEDIRKALFRLAVKQDTEVLELHREEQKLEDLFQQLTVAPPLGQ
jgi:ABC-2 type transport system ATP-binding protein